MQTDAEAKLCKTAVPSNVEQSFDKFLDPDVDVDDFQNVSMRSHVTKTIYACFAVLRQL